MQRRHLLLGGAAALALSSFPNRRALATTQAQGTTQWKVRSSIGADAIAFLGPLAGGALYTRFYGEDATAFAARLSPQMRTSIADLWTRATAEGFGLLGPNLQVLFSTDGNDADIGALRVALQNREQAILPRYRQSNYWSESDWVWFNQNASQLDQIFAAMEVADFTGFRSERTVHLQARVAEIQQDLSRFDVINWQEKLTGRRFDPVIEVVLLHFAKPHGIKVQGQTFLQSADYDTPTTVRIAAHEMLHPPFDEKGPAAQAALEVLRRDALIMKIVTEHDPQWGYTTLEGMLNEDLVQALDQLISEALGIGRNPADRWRKADDGIHVLAAGLYGLLRQDRWVEQGGSIENWLTVATQAGRLAPSVLHSVASRVLERPVDRLWPLEEAR